ncbi:hypothetical protein D3C80_1817610 [compost metagenome]
MDAWANDAAHCKICSGAPSPLSSIDCSRAWPLVKVPVLSRKTWRIPASASSTAPSRTRMLRRAAREMPDSTAIGTASISGQGVATTSTASTRCGSPLAHQASAAISNVSGMNASA